MVVLWASSLCSGLRTSVEDALADAPPLHALYAFGGHEPYRMASTVVTRYDPAVNSWGNAALMLREQKRHAAVVLAGRFYVLGGYRSTTSPGFSVNAVSRYDPVADAWNQVAPMRQRRCSRRHRPSRCCHHCQVGHSVAQTSHLC